MRFFIDILRNDDNESRGVKPSLYCASAVLRGFGLDTSLQFFNFTDRWPSICFCIDTGNGNEGIGTLFAVSVMLLWWSFSFHVQFSDYSECFRVFDTDEYRARVASVESVRCVTELGFFKNERSCIGPCVRVIDDGAYDNKWGDRVFDLRWRKTAKGDTNIRELWHGRWRKLPNTVVDEMKRDYGEEHYCTTVLASDFRKHLDH